MRWYRKYSDVLAASVLILAFATALASLTALVRSPVMRDVLTAVLPSIATLVIAAAAILGLRTWRKQASRTLAREVLRAAWVLKDRARDAATSGRGTSRTLPSLVDSSGMFIDTPWGSRTALVAAVLDDLRARRGEFLQAKLDWVVACEEVRTSAWVHVAEAADQVTALAERLSTQLMYIQSLAGVWRTAERVAEPEKQRSRLKEQEGRFDEAADGISEAVQKVQEILRGHLGL